MFEGDCGGYMIKSGRLRYDSIEKLIRKYYQRAEKQESVAAMVYGKINNLPRINEMLRTESVLYLYDITANPELQLKTDYLLVNQQTDVVLQLGIIKAVKSKEQICRCNSFMVDYKISILYCYGAVKDIFCFFKIHAALPEKWTAPCFSIQILSEFYPNESWHLIGMPAVLAYFITSHIREYSAISEPDFS